MDTADRHKQQVRRFYEEMWNRRDLSVVPDILHPHITFRGSLGQRKTGHAEVADYVRTVTDALADYRCDIEALMAEGDRAVARMMFSGLHRSTLLGVPATGRGLSWAGAAFFTFSNGLVSDLWVLGDLHDLHEQLVSGSPDV